MSRRSQILQAAVSQGLLDPDVQLMASFIDEGLLEENVARLIEAFPDTCSVRHAFAAKANPLSPLLRRLRSMGMAVEVASSGELTAALEAGFEPKMIIFDSPAKTKQDLQRSLDLGVAINIDNYQELARVVEIRKTTNSTSVIGIRINPQVGAGSIKAMSTADSHSKFGVPVGSMKDVEKLFETLRRHSWITGLHVHVGSQGCPLSLIARGIKNLYQIAEIYNRRVNHKQISTLDIGGGLPVDFSTDNAFADFDDYVSTVKEKVPELFSGKYQIITEFGRSILAKQGFIASTVEYTKTVGDRQITIAQAGVQVAARTVYMPDSWPLRVECFNHDGTAKPASDLVQQDIAGPCCFAGDVVASNRSLPPLRQGDIVALLDTGAYYASSPYMYNSLPLSGMYLAKITDNGVRFDTLRKSEYNQYAGRLTR